MGRRHREHSPLDIYHVTSRGVGQLLIFEDDEDRRMFISLLQSWTEQEAAIVFAWCLMSNHFHLVVEMSLERLSAMMGAVKSRYAAYFNERHGRKGHLFEQRYWSTPITSEEQLLEAVRYVHMNPQVAKVAPANKYPWSSYHSYANGVVGLVDPAPVLAILGGIDAFVAFHKEGPKDALAHRPRWTRMRDEMATEVACRELGLRNITELLAKPQQKRDEGIHLLKERGFSCELLQRLTGLGKAVILRA